MSPYKLICISISFCLNPCYNGICSMSELQVAAARERSVGLNPCYNGICSMSWKAITEYKQHKSLNPCYNGICSMSQLYFQLGGSAEQS